MTGRNFGTSVSANGVPRHYSEKAGCFSRNNELWINYIYFTSSKVLQVRLLDTILKTPCIWQCLVM